MARHSRKIGGRGLTAKKEEQIRNPKTIEQIYEEILRGERKIFPSGTFKDKTERIDYENSRRLTRYFVENVLIKEMGWKLDEIVQKIDKESFDRNKLCGMLAVVFEHSPSAAIMNAYSTLPWKGREVWLKPYYFSQCPKNTWTLLDGTKNYELAREATKEMVYNLMEKYSWKLEDVPQKIQQEHFSEKILPFNSNVSGMLNRVYNLSPSAAIIDAFETIPWNGRTVELKPYHFTRCARHTWTNPDGSKNNELAKEATRELVEILMENNNWGLEDIPKNITGLHFEEYLLPFNANLSGMLQHVYNASPSEAIIDTFQTLPWNGKEVKLKPYYFLMSPSNTWVNKDGTKNYELAREATRELVNLLTDPTGDFKWKLEDVPSKINLDKFNQYLLPFNTNLSGMIHKVYNTSPQAAIIDAFPTIKWNNKEIELKPYHFMTAPQNAWIKKDGTKNYELAREATKEMVYNLMEKYSWKLEDVPQKIKLRHFREPNLPFNARLKGMITSIYHTSPQAALKDAYPELYK